MKAMIFAAGLGTRLKPLTDSIPKALAPVAGHTLLYHVLMRLRDSGIDEFVINVHHFADKVIDYVHGTPELAAMNIKFSDERDLLRNTGGGIRYARPLLDGDHFLIHNVDIISDLDIGWFESEIRPDAMSTLLVSQRKTQRYFLFDENMRLQGWTNLATGAVKTPFRNLDPSRCHMGAFAGIHLPSHTIFEAFDAIDAAPADYPLYDETGTIIPGSQDVLGQCFSVVDFYLRAAAKYPIYGKEPSHLTLIDAGKPETLSQAETFLSGDR